MKNLFKILSLVILTFGVSSNSNTAEKIEYLKITEINNMKKSEIQKGILEYIFNKTLSQEANKYLLAVDIDYKILNKSINVRKIVATKFNEKSFILILISTFLTSLIISVLFIFFKKYK